MDTDADAFLIDEINADEAPADDGWTRVDAAIAAVSLVGLLATWELTVRLLSVQTIVLPAPSAVVRSLIAIIASGTLWPHLGVTLSEILSGFAIGSTAAFVLGALMAQFRIVDRLVLPYVVAVQAVPKVAIAPLLVIWFGFGLTSKIIMTAVIAFFPILMNTVVGLRSVPQDRLDLMIAMKATPWQVFRYVRLPTALPFIFAGLDVGIVLSVIGAIVGEFVGASAGIGYLILVYNADLKIDAVFALLAVLAILGISLHGAVLLVQRRVMFWNVGSQDRAARL